MWKVKYVIRNVEATYQRVFVECSCCFAEMPLCPKELLFSFDKVSFQISGKALCRECLTHFVPDPADVYDEDHLFDPKLGDYVSNCVGQCGCKHCLN